MSDPQRKRLTTLRTTESAQGSSRQAITKALEAARLANERGQIAALTTALAAVTTARSTDTRV